MQHQICHPYPVCLPFVIMLISENKMETLKASKYNKLGSADIVIGRIEDCIWVSLVFMDSHLAYNHIDFQGKWGYIWEVFQGG